MAKNLITQNILNKKSLVESSVLYIFEDDLITPGAKDFIIQKKYKCQYIKQEELKGIIVQLLKEEADFENLEAEKVSEIINKVFEKII